jgi:hypothetical protein
MVVLAVEQIRARLADSAPVVIERKRMEPGELRF